MARRGKIKTWCNSPKARLSPRGDERQLPPVTLPKLVSLNDTMPEHDVKDRVERFAEYRTIRAGRDAWEEIGRAESFESWKSIGAALAIGKAYALRVTGANSAWGRNYSREFGKWLNAHGFARMPKSTRSVAIELHENTNAIEAWRATLPERQRKRLVHPLSNVRRWRAATQPNGKAASADLKREALAAWRKFVSCIKALPSDQIGPLLEQAFEQAAAMAHG